VILDRNGMIRHRKSGFGPEGEKELRGLIESLLREGEKADPSERSVDR
jgi:hypothetical protein